MFAAFPGWYATVFSTLYLPLLAILFGMIVCVPCPSNGAARSTTRSGGAWADFGIAAGSWLPAVLWGVAFAILVHGLPVDAKGQVQLSITDVLNAYTLLGGLATCGAVSVLWRGVRCPEDLRPDPRRRSPIRGLAITPGDRTGCRIFGLWTQLAYGKNWTWLVLGVAVVAQLAAVALVWRRAADGWAFLCTALVVAAVVILLFGALYPNLVPSTLNKQWNVTIYNASSTPTPSRS